MDIVVLTELDGLDWSMELTVELDDKLLVSEVVLLISFASLAGLD